ncbi:MerR family transcriptional regulator [Bacillus methanolicus MGA3]|uniref:MerR family transcriptional regulator n=1 Tax=Bacillus methanolicus (strain MGA3 / ATCC 53907) TaxID=796606 RepID=I3E7B6_BACMM|nr:MerR family transcriptional regulator [Bacillus methanolicus MGA3]EIJ82387.1 MerR family transcriptional regulator [Bacillus methanolicus MGA3]
MSGVSKRTIDYYTSLGLLKADRSKSNYRIYSEEALIDLKFIEECKSMHFPLEEIKRKLEIKKSKQIRESEVEKHVSNVTNQMRQLHNELAVILPLIKNLDGPQKEDLANKLSREGSALMQSLLILTS